MGSIAGFYYSGHSSSSLTPHLLTSLSHLCTCCYIRDMPKALNVDWEPLKALYIKGVPLPEIAKQTGVSYVALRARAHRYNWKGDAAAATAILEQSATRTLVERGQDWGNRIATLMEKRLDHLERLDPGKLKLNELEALTRITELTDKTARRTFGMDEAQPQVSVGLVGITLHTKAYEKQVLDKPMNTFAESADEPKNPSEMIPGCNTPP